LQDKAKVMCKCAPLNNFETTYCTHEMAQILRYLGHLSESLLRASKFQYPPLRSIILSVKPCLSSLTFSWWMLIIRKLDKGSVSH